MDKVIWVDARYGTSFMGKRTGRDKGLVSYMKERFPQLGWQERSADLLGPSRLGNPVFCEGKFSWPDGKVYVFKFDCLYPADDFFVFENHVCLSNEKLSVGSFHQVIELEVWQ